MTIHEDIRKARLALKWSMQKLADEVSDREGLPEGMRLNWQAVQQWENGKAAPKRTRMDIVRELLGLAAAPEQVIEPNYAQLLRDLEDLAPSRRSKFIDQIHQAAEEAREAAAHLAARERVMAARKGSDKARASLSYGDGNTRQRTLPLTRVADPFTAEPDARESAFYDRLERAPKEPHDK